MSSLSYCIVMEEAFKRTIKVVEKFRLHRVTRKRVSRIQSLLLSIFTMAAVSAYTEGPWAPFEGDFVVGGKSIQEPSTNTSSLSHIRFRIHGKAAENMYQMIEDEAFWNQCGINHFTKKPGNIECDFIEKTDTYSCYFGIGIEANDVVKGVTC